MNAAPPWWAQQAPIFRHAVELGGGRGLPPFPQPIPHCTPFNASPYVLTHEMFTATFADSADRQRLLAVLDQVIADAADAGAQLRTLMVGGSYLATAQASPRDLDCVHFYAAPEPAPDLAARLQEIRAEAGRNGVDIRFIPCDGDPLVALKACSFFTLLYSRTRSSAHAPRGCVMLVP